jgi:hypothetical protein
MLLDVRARWRTCGRGSPLPGSGHAATQPYAAAVSCRASYKPLASAMGFMTPNLLSLSGEWAAEWPGLPPIPSISTIARPEAGGWTHAWERAAVSAGCRDLLHRAVRSVPSVPLVAGVRIAAPERLRWIGMV